MPGGLNAEDRDRLVSVLGALEAAERYFRARDEADAARYLAARVRSTPLTVRVETASLTLRALLSDPVDPTTEEEKPE
jgi:hypothetical protein